MLKVECKREKIAQRDDSVFAGTAIDCLQLFEHNYIVTIELRITSHSMDLQSVPFECVWI